MTVSPVVSIGALRLGRVTMDSKITSTARTGFGGVDESVTRTVTGRQFWPVLTTYTLPATGSSLSAEAGTAVA